MRCEVNGEPETNGAEQSLPTGPKVEESCSAATSGSVVAQDKLMQNSKGSPDLIAKNGIAPHEAPNQNTPGT